MSDRYAGRIHARLSRPGLHLAETSYTGGQEVARHAHERPLTVLVVAGAMREHVRSRELDLRAGSVLYHPPGESHAHRFGDRGSRCLVLELGPSWIERLGLDPAVMPGGPETGLDQAVTGTARLLHREFRRGEAAHTAALDGLTLTLLASLGRTEDPRPETRPVFLGRVLERLHDDVASDAELSSLAELAGISPEHLARTFRREMDCTVGEYVRRLRVDRARTALETGDVPLSSLALDLGFYDQSHFTRTFKAHVGCPPGEYRRRTGGGRG